VTAPSSATDPGLRDRLAEELWRVHREALVVTAAEEADALLPVVAAWGEQQARERAAVEMEAAAADIEAVDWHAARILILIRHRAAALRGQA
jgi:DNA polymerase IIIc chi subunit